jgi:sodium/potassium-transporting ATPase subunit alpha
MFGSMVVSACILIVLLYVPGINSAFGGRPLPFFMLIVPGAGFSTFFLLWSELRKKILCK